MQWQGAAGAAFATGGALLAAIPTRTGSATASPHPFSTWWPLGVPLIALGLLLFFWDWRVRRPTR